LRFGHPFESVGRQKQERLVRSAKHFLSAGKSRYKALRFDVLGLVCAAGKEVEYELLRGAFEA
tara:strand:+ start:506 stop:694 length:189 start_codon:yes stop_codon:yes gene_type:complete